MTQPALAYDTPNGRHYTDPTIEHEHQHPSITEIIGAAQGKKPGLEYWQAQQTVEACKKNHDEHGRWLDDNDKHLIQAARRASTRAGERGDIVHAALEGWFTTGTITRPSTALDGPAARDALPYLDQLELFLDRWPLRVLWQEVTVISHTRQYAGTGDLWAHVPGKGLMLLDLKTSKKVYADTSLQLAALRYADHAITYDDDGAPQQTKLPPVAACGVILITEDTNELIEVIADEKVFAAFLDRAAVRRWTLDSPALILGTVEPPIELGHTRPSPKVAGLVAQIRRLIDAGHGDELARAWPPGLPMLKGTVEFTEGELLAIEYFVTAKFGEHENDIPFSAADTSEWFATRAAAATALTLRLRELPGDLLAAVEASTARAGVGPLKRASEDAYLYALEAVELAEVEAADRHSHLVRVVGDCIDDDDLAELLPALVFAATGRAKPLNQILELEADAIAAVARAVQSGFATFVFGDDGAVGIESVPGVVDRLVAAFGNKSHATTTARPYAKRHKLASPRSAAALGADVLLTGLALQERMDL